MQTKALLSLIALLVLTLAFSLQPSALLQAAPLGTTFTYQGRLTEGANPANGNYDLTFTLYSVASGGRAVSGPITNSPVSVTNGLFTTTLDFGDGVFTGDARWLEIWVRPNGGGAFTVLSPRQRLTATPYALGLRLPYAGQRSVDGDAFRILNDTNIAYATGIRGIQGGPASFSFSDRAGVRGESTNATGAGVLGISDSYIGVFGYAHGDDAHGVFGRADGAGGKGVSGWATGVDGWAGYFQGRSYFSGDVGVGKLSPAARLDVSGTAKVTGFQMPTGATAGKVLTADASGNGTWQAVPATSTFAISVSGSGNNPTATTQFLSPFATVTITAGQKIFVTANKAFGSTVAGGADGLDLYIGYRVAGSGATPTLVGGGILNNRVPQNTRITMGISGVISGIAAGTYEVGMAGDDDGNGNWNSNEWGFVSVLVLD